MDSNQASCSPTKCMNLSATLHASIQAGLVACLIFVPLYLPAQKVNHCPGPSVLERAIAEHPSAAAYDALGAHFAGKGQFSCAISAFKSAIRLDPGSWQGHYNLGVAL